MPANTSNLFRSIFRSKSSQEKNNAISGAFASSLVSSTLLASLSGGKGKGRPCLMNFHKEWKHPDCMVMDWLKRQELSPGSDQFNTIQHWHNSETPFYHEYLIIQLTDGSACRVERMGEGSRTDAIRWIGCLAQDIIQWFPKGSDPHTNGAPGRKQPTMIVEVSFPRDFDLHDVLAVCFSVQQHKKAASYTLQRYNCYFLCSTILAILSRRVGEWETCTDLTCWNSIVEDTLRDISQVKQEDTVHFVSFGIFLLLDLGSSNPINHILDSLRRSLDNTALQRLSGALSGLMWDNDLLSAVEIGLLTPLSSATRSTPSDDANSSECSRLFNLPGGDQSPETDTLSTAIQKEVSSAIIHGFAGGAKYVVERKQEKRRTREMETRKSLYDRMTASLFRGAVVYPLIFKKFLGNGSNGDMAQLFRELEGRYHITPAQILYSFPLATSTNMGIVLWPPEENELDSDEDFSRTMDIISKLTLERMYPICQSLVASGQEDVQRVLAVLNTCIPRDFWELGVWSSVFKNIRDHLQERLSQRTVTVCKENISKTWTIPEFQKHLHSRIEDHAKRVENVGLAAAQPVRDDIARAITDIWGSMPMGFGACVPAVSSEDAIRQKLTCLPFIHLMMKLVKQMRNETAKRLG